MSEPFGADFYAYNFSRGGVGGRPPPDVTEYVDLAVYDKSDFEIVQSMIAAGQLSLPGWNPNEGNVEVLLIELFGYAIAELIAATNRVPGAVVQAILQMAGVTIDYGDAATATAVLTFSDPLGHSIPAGTRFYLTTDRQDIVVLQVADPGASADYGATACSCVLVSDTFTSAANGMQAGTPLYPADNLPFLDSAYLSSPVVDGVDPESDAAWRARGVARLNRLSDVLVIPRQFALAARERPEVARAVAIDNYNPVSDTGQRVNLVTDPSLEAGVGQVTLRVKRTPVTATAPTVGGSPVTVPDGKQFGTVTVTGDANSSTIQYDAIYQVGPFAVIPGTDYVFRYDGNSATRPFYGRVGVAFLDQYGAALTDGATISGEWSALPVGDTTYQTLEFTGRAPKNARQAYLTMAVGNGGATAGAFRFDRLLVEDARTYDGTWIAGTVAVPHAGADYGHITVAVLGDGSALLSDPAKATIQAALSYPRAASMLVVHVVDVDIVTVHVDVTFAPLYAADGPVVAEAIRQALIAYLDPISWAYGAIVRHNELVALVDRVPGVDWVGTVTVAGAAANGAGDLTMTSPVALPHWGTITATVTS